MSDDDLIEKVAKAMWDWCHDGSWEDIEYCVSQETRDIYLTDARIAIQIVRANLRQEQALQDLADIDRDLI